MANRHRPEGEDAAEASLEGRRAKASCAQTAGTAEAMAGRSIQQSAGGRQPGGTSLLSRIADLITWKRPLYSTVLFIATNSIFWFVALGSWRVYFVLAVCLIGLVTVQTIRDIMAFRNRGAHLWHSMTESWEVIDTSQESRAGANQFTDSWISCKLFLQEMSSFKQQNPGKFCLLVCSLCTCFAILGRYIPGIIISYIAVLGVFLWPLLSSHEFGVWVEPVLQKLDFGVCDFLQRMRENHEKRILQSQEEGSETDLSSLFPKLDSAACREHSISDTEVSEVTWTENGTFSLSEGHTPQTEDSEDLDRHSDHDEVFAGGLPEFPSVDNGTGTNGDDDELSFSLPAPPPPPPPPVPQEAPGPLTLELVHRMAGDVIAAAVTAAIQEQIEAHTAPPRPVPPSKQPLDITEDSESEAEDFELLDQSELEQLEGDLGLERAAREAAAKPSKPSFFSRLLGRH
ncbi:reticulophagy regulator 1 isoform X1 [Megalops cyprinoides]|uniref:reticulophagy regulator 1 isoform X1 n=1 Tax=Megalops cyprinoides TaxID=118141 RepID=UPI0018647793|nr:reticulophagy regulator 1 isoform X1 [Megalops cyprinoides]